MNKFTTISIILVICGLSDKANAPLSNSNIARGCKFFFVQCRFLCLIFRQKLIYLAWKGVNKTLNKLLLHILIVNSLNM